MSSKKKPAGKPALQPLLKLKFEKFPDKQVPVFFNTEKREFRAAFGFEEYTAFSVGQLEGKIKAAIVKGARPDVEWMPAIVISNDGAADWKSPDKLSAEAYFTVERLYISIGKSGLREVEWKVAPGQRSLRAQDSCAGFNWGEARKLRIMPKLPHADKAGEAALLPYDEAMWQKLSAVIGQLQAARASFDQAIKKLNFDSVFIPKAAAAPKPAQSQPTAKKKSPPAPAAINPQQKLWTVLDALVDVRALGEVPKNVLIAAGFQARSAGYANKDRNEYVIQQPDFPTHTYSRQELEKRIRENWNSGLHTLFEPIASAAPAPAKTGALGKSFSRVREETAKDQGGLLSTNGKSPAIGTLGKPKKKPKPTPWTPEIPNGPIPETVLVRIGYPPGTKATFGSGPSGAHIDIKPPNHVGMLYSRDWLVDKFRSCFRSQADRKWLEQVLRGTLPPIPGANQQSLLEPDKEPVEA